MKARILSISCLCASLAASACGDTTTTLPPRLFATVDATTAECPEGGRTLISGVDDNRNGALDDAEIAAREPVCSGGPGAPGMDGSDGLSAIVRTTDEPAGDNCDNGGVRIEVGSDADGSGTLDPSEVQQTSFACDGAQGVAGLQTLVLVDQQVGEACDGAGIRLRFGLDDNRNGVLDPAEGEVDETRILCDGEEGLTGLTVVTAEPAGMNCTVGGQRLDVGIDADGTGTLDAGEIEDTQYICDPVQRLVRVSAELAGTSTACAENGGSRVEAGGDVNGNGTLEEAEVDEVTFICGGGSGLQTLVAVTPEAAGPNCAAGGNRIESGVDADQNGTLETSEVTTTTFACNGVDGADGSGGNLVLVSDEPPGVNCASGGTRIESGADGNGNGALDAGEVTSTSFACDSVSQGLVVTSPEPAGANCASGGARIEQGLDDNNNGTLEPGEVDSTQFVCGATGTAVPFSITTASLPSAAFTVDAFNQSITASGGTGGNYEWDISAGALPPGYTLDPTGTPSTTLSGSGSTAGVYTFTVRVTDFFEQTAEREFTIEILSPPCEPGVNGQVGDTVTTVSVSSSFGTLVTGLAADTSSTGFVYFVNDGSELERFDKVTGTVEDVVPLVSGLAAADVNYIYVDGDDIYLTSDDISCVSDCIWRISTDGGQTFLLEDLGDFSGFNGGSGTDDQIKGIVVEGTTLYAITKGTSEAELYELDLSGGVFPVVPTLLATLSLEECGGLAVDDDFFYTLCDSTLALDEGLARIDRTTFAVDVQADNLAIGTITGAQLYAHDLDADGLADVIYAQGDSGNQRFYCDPADAFPLFSGDLGGSGDDEGLAYDPVNNVLWQVDEGTSNAFNLQ